MKISAKISRLLLEISNIIAYNSIILGEGGLYMTFGKAIKEQRIKKGLTQAQLAEMLGKAESTVRTWELDRSSPD